MSDSDKQYYYNGRWVSWDELHSEGYTKDPAKILTLYDNKGHEAPSVMQDTSDNTIYDAPNRQWVEDINELNKPLYQKVGEITLYQCDQPFVYTCYTDTIKNDVPKYVDYYSAITEISELYTSYGITQYKCTPFIVDDGTIVAWYDSIEELYWDNRDQYKKWTAAAPKPIMQVVDASDFDILNIDLRPSLVMYSLTREQLSSIEFMRFGVDVGLNFVDHDDLDFSMLNLPIEISLKMYNINQPLQLLHIRI